MELTYSNQPGNGQNLLSRLFQDKLDRQKLSVLEIADLIGERKDMLKTNLRALDYKLCDIGSIKHSLEGIRYFSDLDAHLKTRLSMEKALNELELKKAEEYKQCWHDICDLRKEFMAGFLEYESIQKKAEILEPKSSYSAKATPAAYSWSLAPLTPFCGYESPKQNTYSWYSKPQTNE